MSILHTQTQFYQYKQFLHNSTKDEMLQPKHLDYGKIQPNLE